jgi:hypothetical protein
MEVFMIQYDLFTDETLIDEKQIAIDNLNDRVRRTQKRFFAQNKEIVNMYISQQKEIDELKKRLDHLLKEINK